MHPEIPERRILENPYQYTEWDAGRAMEAMSTVGSERLTAVVGDVLAALHEVLERHQVTEQEWMAALAFLTEVGRADEFVLLSDVTRTSVLIDALSHARGRGGRDGERRRGPALPRGPAVPRGEPAKIYEAYEGMGDADVLIVGGTVTSTDGGDRCPTPSSTSGRPAPTAATTSGTSASRSTTSAAGSGSTEDGGYAVPDDAPEALHGPDRRARSAATWRRSASTRGARRTSTSR